MQRRVGWVVLGLLVAPAIGLAQTAASRFAIEPNLDRSGNDIKSVKLAPEALVDACERLCEATKGCISFTFVKRSSTVPEPICWLKDATPVGYPSSCCTSGVLKK